MPLPLLGAYMEMYESLQARESLEGMTVGAMAFGAYEKADARGIKARWERAAYRSRRARLATPADLAVMGIRYVPLPTDTKNVKRPDGKRDNDG